MAYWKYIGASYGREGWRCADTWRARISKVGPNVGSSLVFRARKTNNGTTFAALRRLRRSDERPPLAAPTQRSILRVSPLRTTPSHPIPSGSNNLGEYSGACVRKLLLFFFFFGRRWGGGGGRGRIKLACHAHALAHTIALLLFRAAKIADTPLPLMCAAEK